jgi:RNA polymerase sigma-54 factor
MDARTDGTPDAPMDQEFNTAADDSGPADAWGGDDGAGFEAGSQWGSGGGGSFEDREGGLEGTLAQGMSLRDHLMDQINVDIPDQVGRVIAQYLMGMLDDAGYLSGTLEEAAEALGCPVEQVDGILARLQSMDPPGLFARSLKECLALQLADRNRLDPAMQALLDNLELLAKRDVAALLKVCGVDGEDLSEMIGEIRALDPKPALRFDIGMAQPVVPDVLMRPDPQGGWIVELNGETLPRVLVNNRYMARLSKSGDKETKAFVSESLATANWLVKSLDQRANTILKVAAEIVRRQDAFFVHGVTHLRPLILRDIAEAIEMHESTVSRVTSNKYISTPRGLYELKYFFTQAIAGSDGAESHSAESVRHRIKVLIDEEPPEKVLSDDRIVELLKSEGVDIARRTVAKYREGMKIPSSVRRRREKTSQLS